MAFVVCKCEFCRGSRRHEVLTTDRGEAGPTTRVRQCPACDTCTPYGICCPECGDVRFGAVYTRHRPDGSCVRVKQCVPGRHRIRTREAVESTAAAAGPAAPAAWTTRPPRRRR